MRNFILHFRSRQGVVRAVDDVSLELDRGQTIAVLGESGCGKSSLARAMLRQLPRNVQRFSGRMFLNDRELISLSARHFRRDIRWQKMALVPQAAMNSLHPTLRIDRQVAEPLLVHGHVRNMREAEERVFALFTQLGLPVKFMSRYAFELSGGMRQRVAIAMALVLAPKIVILDEPTSALDLLTQANIINVLKMIKHRQQTSFILITHDVAVASQLADEVAVMYAGQIVERALAEDFYRRPFHPYAEKMMASVPTLSEKKSLPSFTGQPPSLVDPVPGCRFAGRCHRQLSRCYYEEPPLVRLATRQVKCWLYG